jgi:hypothetical protein
MRRPIAAVDWAGAGLCAGVLLAIAALSARPAAAQEPRFAAVAVSPTKLYSSQSHGSPQAAVESHALQTCQASGAKDCTLVHTVMNGCVAVAIPAKAIPNYYGYGSGTTRESAAAQALADCAKGGVIGCEVPEAPCSSDDLRWDSPLPLPPGGKPGSVDPRLVGLWKLNIDSGIWVWQISANGTYTVHSEAPDNAPSSTGTFAASNGKYTMHAITTQYDDQGTYTLPSSGVMVASGKLGTGTWYRIASDPNP